MLKAETDALLQSQNIGVLQTRQAELEYFVSVFNSIGTQAALIAGFSISSLTGIDLTGQPLDAAKALYFLLSTFTLCFSSHCILTTVFTVVCGPGLALRGPPGSMVRAVDGMLAERDQIFNAFVYSIATFAGATAATFWVIMENTIALVCTVLIVIASAMWYHYCLRIYNRFKYSDATKLIDEDERQNPHKIIDKNNENKTKKAKEHLTENLIDSDDESSSVKDRKMHSGGKETAKISKSKGFGFGAFFKSKNKKDDVTASAAGSPRHGEIPSIDAFEDDDVTDDSMITGYLSHSLIALKGDKSTPWNRYFCVLDQQNMYCYRNANAFKMRQASIYSRPLEVSAYRAFDLKDELMKSPIQAKYGSEVLLKLLKEKDKSQYVVVLVPIAEDDDRRGWILKCDTGDEFTRWMTALRG